MNITEYKTANTFWDFCMCLYIYIKLLFVTWHGSRAWTFRWPHYVAMSKVGHAWLKSLWSMEEQSLIQTRTASWVAGSQGHSHTHTQYFRHYSCWEMIECKQLYKRWNFKNSATNAIIILSLLKVRCSVIMIWKMYKNEVNLLSDPQIQVWSTEGTLVFVAEWVTYGRIFPSVCPGQTTTPFFFTQS